MIDLRNALNGNPFEEQQHLESEGLPRFLPTKDSFNKSFLKIPIVIACTVLVFILLIAGTATTAISYPPEPSYYWKESKDAEGPERHRLHTALDGNYKLLGPLLIMGGAFLLIIDVVLCAVFTKEAYLSSRTIRPNSDIPANSAMSLWGGPFFLAVPSSASNHEQSSSAFPFSRQLWAMPNAPLPDFVMDGLSMKGSRARPATATLSRCHQPPFNPDVEKSKSEE